MSVHRYRVTYWRRRWFRRRIVERVDFYAADESEVPVATYGKQLLTDVGMRRLRADIYLVADSPRHDRDITATQNAA